MTGQMETRCTNQNPTCRDDGTDGRPGAPIRSRAVGMTGQMETRCTNQNLSCMDDGTDGDQVHQSEPKLHG